MTAPVIYEVTLHVRTARQVEYRAWLAAHIEEILALPGFTGAQVHELLEPVAPDGWPGLCVHYRLVDAEALAIYLQDHAPRLRADGLARFGEDFRAQRRVLRPLAQGLAGALTR